MKFAIPISAALLSIGIIFGILLMSGSFKTVPTGHVGIKTTFNKVQDVDLKEGLNAKIPMIEEIIIMDCRIQKVQTETSSASKDLQDIKSTIAVNSRVDRTQARNLFKEVGIDYSNIIVSPAIQEAVKAVTSQYTAEELVTRRSEVSENMNIKLQEKLKNRGIIIEGFNIINFSFSEQFNQAIESKQTAEQLALKAQRDLDRIKIEGEQKIVQAKAEAEGLRAQKQEITPELLKLREIEAKIKMIEKWDGKLPGVMAGDSGFNMMYTPK